MRKTVKFCFSAVIAAGALLGAKPNIASADTINIANDTGSVQVAPGVYQWTFDITTDPGTTQIHQNATGASFNPADTSNNSPADGFALLDVAGLISTGTYAPTLAADPLNPTYTHVLAQPFVLTTDASHDVIGSYAQYFSAGVLQNSLTVPAHTNAPDWTLTVYSTLPYTEESLGTISQDHNPITGRTVTNNPGTPIYGPSAVPLPNVATSGAALFGLLALCGVWKMKQAQA